MPPPEEERRSGGGDRAPRSVQRHRSHVNIDLGNGGTLIMTDDPADYETQDGGKKPEDEEEDEYPHAPHDDYPQAPHDDHPRAPRYEQDAPHYDDYDRYHRRHHYDDHPRRHSREEDPTLDDSYDRYNSGPSLSHSSRHNDDAYHHSRRRSGPVHRTHSSSNESERSMDFPPSRRHTFNDRHRDYQHGGYPERHHQQYQHQQPPSTRKAYHHTRGDGSGSINTLPTAYMGSSSRGLHLDESERFADDVSSLSSGRSSRFHHHHHLSGGMSNSSRRLGGARSGEEIHYHGRSSNGLPVITREQPSYHPASGSRRSHSGPMEDVSRNSMYSHGSSGNLYDRDESGYHQSSSSSRNLMRPVGGPPRGMMASSMRHMNNNSGRNLMDHARRGASSRDLHSHSPAPQQQGGEFRDRVLPSLAPLPVPTMDSPEDVDSMAVFARDVSQNQQGTRRTSDARKDRGKMLDNLSRSGALTSNRSLMGGSSTMGLGSRRNLSSAPSQRGMGNSSSRQLLPEEPASNDQPGFYHPGLVRDEALDSPNTRRERRKEKRRMKGAVRNLMANMRISGVASK